MSDFPSIPMTTEETIEFNKWLECHDMQIVKKTLDKVWKKAISMHDDYVELEELDNYIEEIISEIK